MKLIITAVRDTLSGQIIGGLQLFPHAAPAVRFFSDLINDQKTQVARHVDDHELINLGTLLQPDEGGNAYIEAELTATVIITGKQLREAQQATEGNQK